MILVEVRGIQVKIALKLNLFSGLFSFKRENFYLNERIFAQVRKKYFFFVSLNFDY